MGCRKGTDVDAMMDSTATGSISGGVAGEVSHPGIFILRKFLVVMVLDERWKSTQFRLGGDFGLGR